MTFKQVSELSWISDNGQWIIKKHQSGSHDLYSLWNWHQLVDYFFTREDAEQAANDGV